MRALVTGATGYTGQAVCRALAAAGWEVHAPIRETVPTDRLARLPEAVRRHGGADPAALIAEVAPRLVVHLAAAAPDAATDALLAVNVTLPTRLAEAAAARPGTALLHAATWWEWAEDGALRPANPYAASKTAGRLMIEALARRHDIPVTGLVLHDTFGPDDWRGKLLPSLVAASPEAPLPLTPGDQCIDLVHVEDVAEAFVVAAALLLEPPTLTGPALYSVASGRHRSVRDIVAEMEALLGRPLPVVFGARPHAPGTLMRPGCPAPFPPGWRARRDLADWLGRRDA